MQAAMTAREADHGQPATGLYVGYSSGYDFSKIANEVGAAATEVFRDSVTHASEVVATGSHHVR
jgi:hypothetical protein